MCWTTCQEAPGPGLPPPPASTGSQCMNPPHPPSGLQLVASNTWQALPCGRARRGHCLSRGAGAGLPSCRRGRLRVLGRAGVRPRAARAASGVGATAGLTVAPLLPPSPPFLRRGGWGTPVHCARMPWRARGGGRGQEHLLQRHPWPRTMWARRRWLRGGGCAPAPACALDRIPRLARARRTSWARGRRRSSHRRATVSVGARARGSFSLLWMEESRRVIENTQAQFGPSRARATERVPCEEEETSIRSSACSHDTPFMEDLVICPFISGTPRVHHPAHSCVTRAPRWQRQFASALPDILSNVCVALCVPDRHLTATRPLLDAEGSGETRRFYIKLVPVVSHRPPLALKATAAATAAATVLIPST